ncbi:MAG TPA: hypothetical protein VK485_02140 [Sphingomicrobium sp.]|nr:hypothetical protein [Sphingomicrobium sp.]
MAHLVSESVSGVHFTAFVAIDWSGAKGSRHKGIAIAEARGTEPPRLIDPGRVWSRQAVLDWLLDRAKVEPTLFGFDFSFAPPFGERGAYLPGEAEVPANARSFWAYVDSRSDDDDLGAASFLEKVHRRHFYFGIADGVKADFVRHRICEAVFNARGGGKASSVYDAIGAGQVAKASFAGMRLLHRLEGQVAIWPFDVVPPGSSGVVEIYSRVFLKAARTSGRKLRSAEALNAALANLGSPPTKIVDWLTDHQTDALVTAAGMRALAANPSAFSPPGLTPEIARTEGWTFGVL